MTERAYPFAERDAFWQARWEEAGAFRASDDPADPRPRKYVLDMFPYPSGEGLHVGHPKGYIATDVLSRHYRMRGFNVLHPLGWDAFGLPAEQYALKTGRSPRSAVAGNIERFKDQIRILGLGYDWEREVNTTDPSYYRWTQWIFLRLLEKGLAYEAEVPVNWCEALGTVLANEEVVGGLSERGGHPVVQRPLRQWMLRITEYADRLLDGLEDLDWPEPIKEMQRNWIGRSEGARMRFALQGTDRALEVFTTRPDTVFGATYVVIAPEHPEAESLPPAAWPEGTPSEWTGGSGDPRGAVAAYREEAGRKTERDRQAQARDKSGQFTGAFALNPATGQEIPVFVADYVLMGYGTGAIMAVPGQDERDWEFATTHSLPIVRTVEPPPDWEGGAWLGDGPAINSGFLDGLGVAEAKEAIISWLEAEGHGNAAVSYKLRDWLFSRQRYWGEPIPVVHGPDGAIGLSEGDLPLTLPEMDRIEPPGDGRSPLALARDWVETDAGERETNTMPQWAGSCWYYLRFIDPRNDQALVDPEKERRWMPVDVYVGGAEHAVLHLLYARFWHKVLHDLGVVSTDEPFARLHNVGHVLGADGQKMSKSLGNVVNPDDVVAEVGADAFRLFECFMGPFAGSAPWSTEGISGVRRFLEKAWRALLGDTLPEGEDPNLRRRHATVLKVGEDIETFAFNTAVSALMIYLNDIEENGMSAQDRDAFLGTLTPFAPHLAEEVHLRLGREGLAAAADWPEADPELAREEEVEVPVMVDGKLRARLFVPAGTDPSELERLALALEQVSTRLGDGGPRRVVALPDKLVNIVT